ncbi:DegT/DnrJ/EryC1/StrS family aminotransferase [Propionibacteriaceae bacterium G1746]
MTEAEFIPFARPDITEAEIEAVVETMRNGWLTTGPNAAAFEQEFADFVTGGAGGVHAVAVNSATAGLHLSYEAMGIGPGDEVLVPTWTFTSTAEAVRYLGADPVFVDVDPDTLCIDLVDAEKRLTDRTKVIAPVHFAGLGVPNQALADFAATHGLRIVEDAAHALPTINEGAMIGTHGHDATVYSFYATKTMATGEGGMVLTPHEDVARRMRTMRLHGIDRDVFDRYSSKKPSWHYDIVAPGYKDNLTDTAAAMGRVQLRRLPEMTARRAAIAARYDEAFADLPLQLPAHAPEGSTHAWHLYVVRLTAEAGLNRDAFIQEMADEGVGTSVHFIPMHLQPYWRDTYQLTPEMYPVASAEFERVVSLPIFSSMTDDQVDRVIAAVRASLD